MRKMVWTSFDENDENYKELEKLYAEEVKKAIEEGKRLKFSEFMREIVILGIKEKKKKGS